MLEIIKGVTGGGWRSKEEGKPHQFTGNRVANHRNMYVGDKYTYSNVDEFMKSLD